MPNQPEFTHVIRADYKSRNGHRKQIDFQITAGVASDPAARAAKLSAIFETALGKLVNWTILTAEEAAAKPIKAA